MIDAQRRALAALKFNLAPTPDDVWRPSPYHVAELHREVVEQVIDGVNEARGTEAPLGMVIRGTAGAGKTHLLGLVRQRTQHDGGYFFLVSLVGGKTFWESTALCIVDGLLRETVGGPNQLAVALRRLATKVGLGPAARDAIAGEGQLRPETLDEFITLLRRNDRTIGQDVQDTARALVLHVAEDLDAQDVGYAYLNSLDLADYPQRCQWGLSVAARSPQQVVRDVSRLLALSGGPTLIAYDQLDTLFSQTAAGLLRADDRADATSASVLGQVADGLMSLREVTRATLVVVACLPDTWEIIKRDAAGPVADRFREGTVLHRVTTGKVGLAIVRKRLESRYGEVGFHPPYPTWPIRELAFTESSFFTPRRLLKRVEQHAADCLRANRILELEHLEDAPNQLPAPQPVAAIDFSALDRRFAGLVQEAYVADALAHETEDRIMPLLLGAGLQALVEELDDKAYKQDPPPSARPALHARLRQTLDESIEDEVHWAFRAIAHPHPIAIMSRIRAASTMAGLDASVPKRQVFLLRNSPWPTSPATAAMVRAFHDAGGRTLPIAPDDLKVFEALRVLQAEYHEHFAEWLASRTPASRTALFQAVLGGSSTADDAPGAPAEPVPMAGDAPPYALRIGAGVDSGQPFDLELEALRDTAVVFAGSGAGTTVLMRRLVEECALRGVSAIVVDHGTDLTRLGQPWPQTPSAFTPLDRAKARDYLADTDVVVWDSGRLPALPVLPDLAAVRDDPEEFAVALDLAVASLAPRAMVDGATARDQQGRAVLHDALRHLATGELEALLDLLADLPSGVTQLAKGERIAAQLADTLRAVLVTDPTFAAAGVDVGEMVTAPAGKRARVSVVSLAGLASEEQRQDVVDRLQMALYGWIRRQPADDAPLSGLLVLDEAPNTAATLALLDQARRHGLGLIVATQTPRGLHPQIAERAGTLFFGRLISPIQIAAARELSTSRGGTTLEGLGVLPAGQFEVVAAGRPSASVRTPLCLTHHSRTT
jgi:hypothetical protein